MEGPVIQDFTARLTSRKFILAAVAFAAAAAAGQWTEAVAVVSAYCVAEGVVDYSQAKATGQIAVTVGEAIQEGAAREPQA